jgi:hypothetical protein
VLYSFCSLANCVDGDDPEASLSSTEPGISTAPRRMVVFPLSARTMAVAWFFKLTPQAQRKLD